MSPEPITPDKLPPRCLGITFANAPSRAKVAEAILYTLALHEADVQRQRAADQQAPQPEEERYARSA
jgi:hypothetical protein